MKTYRYIADCGSVRIGNNKFKALFPNGYGDGEFELTYIDGYLSTEGEKYNFVSTFEGEDINVYYYDCPNTKFSAEVLLTLPSGTYGFYNNDGDVLIMKWRD